MNRWMPALLLATGVGVGVGCAAPEVKHATPLGSKTAPVRCDMPLGEQRYLDRLHCADGSRPSYIRVGSFGPGPYGTILDGYEVTCGTATSLVFMDMYHAGYVETQAIPGFQIDAPISP